MSSSSINDRLYRYILVRVEITYKSYSPSSLGVFQKEGWEVPILTMCQFIFRKKERHMVFSSCQKNEILALSPLAQITNFSKNRPFQALKPQKRVIFEKRRTEKTCSS